MTAQSTAIPDLEERFTQPEGWRWHNFTRDNRRMRFGSVFPKDSIPDAVIVCLQGVREFNEKYFETARWALDNNMAFWVFDWMGQGKAKRYLDNPQKRHGEDFKNYVDDLHYLIIEYIKHSSVHPDKGRIPLAMLAHSMGANIGLRYLHQYPTTFECAALSAPMIGLKVFEKIPQGIASFAASCISACAGKSYIPHGGDWVNTPPSQDRLLSSDPKRSLIHNAWMQADPELCCGEVTLGWVNHAQASCRAVQHKDFAPSVKTPLLVGIPAHEHLVDNTMTRKVCARMPHATLLDLPDAHHELLMEQDHIRDAYLGGFYNLITERIIKRPESLKPF